MDTWLDLTANAIAQNKHIWTHRIRVVHWCRLCGLTSCEMSIICTSNWIDRSISERDLLLRWPVISCWNVYNYESHWKWVSFVRFIHKTKWFVVNWLLLIYYFNAIGPPIDCGSSITLVIRRCFCLFFLVFYHFLTVCIHSQTQKVHTPNITITQFSD